MLQGDLWEAELVRVLGEEELQKITGKVIGFNTVEGPSGPVDCFRHRMVEMVYQPLNLSEHMGKTITVTGELRGEVLYGASIVEIVWDLPGLDPAKEARSLNDLLKIRAANRDQIEAVNGNLGTALGFKWKNGQNTGHPAIIIFVPQKVVS